MPADRAPAVLVCLLGPPRQHSAGLSRASHGQFCHRLVATLFHRDTASRPGQRFEDGAICTAAVPLWMPASPQRGWLTCASVPTPLEQWPSVCWQQTGSLLVSYGSRNKSCPSVFPHRPCLCSHENPAHPAAQPAAHTVQPATRSWAHRAASTQPSAAGSSAMQSLCTAQGCSE